ncbi:hypothetical protein ILYODFUR_008881, partial [Ilyodon furcidens]
MSSVNAKPGLNMTILDMLKQKKEQDPAGYEYLQRHLYICNYRFSQDHSQLLFNSIRAPGGWSNNPSAGQFHFLSSHGAVWGVFKFIRKCGNTGVRVFLSAQEMSSSQTAEETEELPSPFADISAIVRDHSYLPTRFGGLVDNAPVCISGFVFRQILKMLLCDMCR